MSVHILIPAYHPSDKLIELVEELRMVFPMTVVDDGSGKEYSGVFCQIETLGTAVLHP